MINLKTLEVGDFVREAKPMPRHYTVVKIYPNLDWFHLEPHMDSKEASVLNTRCIDAYTLVHDFELAGKPECEPSSSPKVGIDPKTLRPGDQYKNGSGEPRKVSHIEDGAIFILDMESASLAPCKAPCNKSYWDLCELTSKATDPKPVQNPSPYRFDLLPAEAMLHIAKVIAEGDAAHGRYNWKKIDALEHHGRAEAHINLAKANDKSEDHWGHAAARAIFALQMAIEEGKVK